MDSIVTAATTGQNFDQARFGVLTIDHATLIFGALTVDCIEFKTLRLTTRTFTEIYRRMCSDSTASLVYGD